MDKQQAPKAAHGHQQHASLQQQARPHDATPAQQPLAQQAQQGQQGQQGRKPQKASRPRITLPKEPQQEFQWVEGVLEEDDTDTEPGDDITQHVLHVALGHVQELREHLHGVLGLQVAQQLPDGRAYAKGKAS
jgi:hypothetical protein